MASISSNREDRMDFYNFLETFEKDHSDNNTTVVLTDNMRIANIVKVFQEIVKELKIENSMLLVSQSYGKVSFDLRSDSPDVNDVFDTGPLSLDFLKSSAPTISAAPEVLQNFYVSQESYNESLHRLKESVKQLITERWL